MPRLSSRDTPTRVLEKLARWLGPATVELILETADESAGRIASWSSGDPGQGERRRFSVEVWGEPEWQLIATGTDTFPGETDLREAAAGLVSWRDAQLVVARAEARLAARAKELDLIQALGRRAAEARSPRDLFSSTIAVLQQGEEIDLALVALRAGSEREIRAHLARPVTPQCLGQLCARVGAVLGWDAESSPPAERVELDSFDEARGVRRTFRDEDVVVLPILRKDDPVACLLVLPSRKAEEGQLRLLYSAGNQLCLHLDRILSVSEAEADRFRSILNSMPQAVVVTDPILRIEQSNPSARRMFERLGLPTTGSLQRIAESLGLQDAVDRVRHGGSTGEDLEAEIEGGGVLTVTVSPLASVVRGARGLVLVITDVTDRRRMQRQLAQSEKMSGLGQMISGVAHELNNPLAGILGYAQLLGRATHDDKQSQRLELLQREAERCQRIVRNLLSFARQHEPEQKPFSLNEVIQSVIALMGYQLRVTGVAVELVLDAELPPLRGDRHQIQQVVVNLLANAQHAIHQAGAEGTIRVSTRRDADGSVAMEVRDSGQGIPDAIRSRIFDPFFTTKSEGEGTGLGLSLVYGIVTAHGGTVEAPPCDGKGARFVLSFPSGADSGATPASRHDPEPEPPVRTGRILVVEDEPSLARMICEMLAEDGHRPVTAPDGRAALLALGREPFDLVISDIRMPGMGGEALYSEIRRNHPGMTERVLLTTGDTVNRETDRFVSESGLPLIRKPFAVDRFRRTVKSRLAALASAAVPRFEDGSDE